MSRTLLFLTVKVNDRIKAFFKAEKTPCTTCKRMDLKSIYIVDWKQYFYIFLFIIFHNHSSSTLAILFIILNKHVFFYYWNGFIFELFGAATCVGCKNPPFEKSAIGKSATGCALAFSWFKVGPMCAGGAANGLLVACWVENTLPVECTTELENGLLKTGCLIKAWKWDRK